MKFSFKDFFVNVNKSRVNKSPIDLSTFTNKSFIGRFIFYVATSKTPYTEVATGGVLKEKVFLKNFAKFTGKHLSQSFFLNKVGGLALQLHQKETLAQVFSCEFCEILKNTSLADKNTVFQNFSRKCDAQFSKVMSLLHVSQYFFLLDFTVTPKNSLPS